MLRRELDYEKIKVFWTDSKDVLAYIMNDTRRFHVFVANRVHYIRDCTSVEQWKYTDSTQNPADAILETWITIPYGGMDQISSESLTSELIISQEKNPEIKKVSSHKTQTKDSNVVLPIMEYIFDWKREKKSIASCQPTSAQIQETY